MAHWLQCIGFIKLPCFVNMNECESVSHPVTFSLSLASIGVWAQNIWQTNFLGTWLRSKWKDIEDTLQEVLADLKIKKVKNVSYFGKNWKLQVSLTKWSTITVKEREGANCRCLCEHPLIHFICPWSGPVPNGTLVTTRPNSLIATFHNPITHPISSTTIPAGWTLSFYCQM